MLFKLQAVTDEMLTELKACFMEAYDDNQDGKIDIREVHILTYKRLKLKSFTQYSLFAAGATVADGGELSAAFQV